MGLAMKTLIVLCLLILVPLRVFAFCDDWRWYNSVLLSGALAYTEADREQTIWFLHHTSQHETNPFFHGHPVDPDVNTKFLGASIVAALLACWISTPYRELFLGGWFYAEEGQVYSNVKNGIPTSVPAPNLGLHWSW